MVPRIAEFNVEGQDHMFCISCLQPPKPKVEASHNAVLYSDSIPVLVYLES